jgi:hypothetical protein
VADDFIVCEEDDRSVATTTKATKTTKKGKKK